MNVVALTANELQKSAPVLEFPGPVEAVLVQELRAAKAFGKRHNTTIHLEVSSAEFTWI